MPILARPNGGALPLHFDIKLPLTVSEARIDPIYSEQLSIGYRFKTKIKGQDITPKIDDYILID